MSFALFVSALATALAECSPRAKRLGLSASDAWNVLVVAALRLVLQELAQARGHGSERLGSGRLFQSVPGFEPDRREAQRRKLLEELVLALPRPEKPWAEQPVEAFGQLYESLLAARPADSQRNLRKRTGSYYTPEALTAVVVKRAFDALETSVDTEALRARPLRILDPALGAGAFLVQAAREIARRSGRQLAQVVQRELFGVDVSPLAVAVAEASLWLLADDAELTLQAAGAQLHEGDALCSRSAGKALGRRGVDFEDFTGDDAGFDLVLGNPPWVAFAGRATQPLPPELREHYRGSFLAFRGYPTLHALFVELGGRLAPRGVIALLIPSPLADLDGYRPVRRALSATHAVHEPLLELGQDAFASVTQPCFALVASPRRQPEPQPERPFVLTERRHASATASQVRTPPALNRLAQLPRLPAELFGEMGLQTNSAITRKLLYRGPKPPPEFSYALLEGRNIAEFELSAPRLFLKPDRAVLAEYRCRLREAFEYARVKVVVRQTAAITIAAAHDGTPFRNSLLACFELPELPFELTLGLLNSTLYRALHLASRRDARQGAFPQVKVSHLRSLPAPVAGDARAAIARLSAQASQLGLTAELRSELDRNVFDMFDISESEGVEIARFVRELSPRAGLTAPLAGQEQTSLT
jgi:SAM-dependent methyltransferase